MIPVGSIALRAHLEGTAGTPHFTNVKSQEVEITIQEGIYFLGDANSFCYYILDNY